MGKSTSGKRVPRSSITGRFVKKTTTGRFVKSPAKSGSVRYYQVDKAVKKVASRRTQDGSH